MKTLDQTLVDKVVAVMPLPIQQTLRECRGSFLAGGSIRSVHNDEKIADWDIFCDNDVSVAEAVCILTRTYGIPHKSRNSYTFRRADGCPIQVIHRWKAINPTDLCGQMDFTIAAACIFWDGYPGSDGSFLSGDGCFCGECHDQREEDVKSKTLTYLGPIRDEEPAGALFRLFKFYKRGYSIPMTTLSRVVVRAVESLPAINETLVAAQLQKAQSRVAAPPKSGVADDDEDLSPLGADGHSANS